MVQLWFGSIAKGSVAITLVRWTYQKKQNKNTAYWLFLSSLMLSLPSLLNGHNDSITSQCPSPDCMRLYERIWKSIVPCEVYRRNAQYVLTL